MVTKINTEDSTHVDDCDRNDDVNGQLFGSQFLVEESGHVPRSSWNEILADADAAAASAATATVVSAINAIPRCVACPTDAAAAFIVVPVIVCAAAADGVHFRHEIQILL